MEIFEAAAGSLDCTEVAASAYRAYAASTGNKNFRGDPMPAFDDLPNPIQTAWEAAIRQVLFLADGIESDEQGWNGWRRPQDLTDDLAA